ncbi:nuclease A inhibitor family protein [Pseudanabaena sp. PCC 6802]|uniref:nuclease A inhibitor family protein n=1 Tax=Pseudanabaena sp. PCC 6802 TaxID=118173 RepID=UPI000349959D|nr:nuclease A inhibitor family protein [Pseudanabaena sp. PCC 6802]
MNQLVLSLEKQIEGLLFASDNFYPFKVFFRDANLGEFTVGGLLQSIGYLNLVSFEQFHRDIFSNLPDIAHKYEEIANLMRSNLSCFEIYQIKTEDLAFQNSCYIGISSFYIILGKTECGNYLGLSTKLNPFVSREFDPSPLIAREVVDDPDLALLNSLLLQTLENYTFPDEFDETRLRNLGLLNLLGITLYPFDSFTWEFTTQKGALLDLLLDSIGLVETTVLDKRLIVIDDQSYVERMSALFKLLSQNLMSIRVYRIGVIQNDIYILGIDNNNNFVGVSTISIDT